MTVQEFYQEIGGNYDNVLMRLRKEALVKQILQVFLKDESFYQFQGALAAGDEKAAFMAIHNLKGTAANLELGRVAELAVELTESLRHGKTPNTDPLAKELEEAYGDLIAKLKTIQ